MCQLLSACSHRCQMQCALGGRLGFGIGYCDTKSQLPGKLLAPELGEEVN